MCTTLTRHRRKQILTNHVVPGVVLAEDIELGTQANTLEGSTLNFTVIDGGIVLVENAQNKQPKH